jgi:fibronectin type 3 domain-containing protein/TolB-like protein
MFRYGRIFIATVAVALVLIGARSGAADQNALAILNLRPTNFEAMGYNGEVMYALVSSLETDKTVELMPRREMEGILFQAGLVQGDTPEMALEAGKVLGINFVLFGNVTKKGSKITAHLSLLDMQTRQVLRSWSPRFNSREDILAKTPEVAGELSATILNREQYAAAAAPAVEASGIEPVVEEFQVKSEGKKVILNWKVDTPGPVTGYHVYRSESEDGPFQFLGKTESPAYEDAQIKKGASYYYQIGILSTTGREARATRTAQIKKAGEKLPHPPLLLSTSGHVKRIQINFIPSLINEQERFKIRHYKIFRKGSAGGDWENIATLSAKITSQSELGFTFEDTEGLEDGRTYSYAISSLDSKDRESAMSDRVTVSTLPRPELQVDAAKMLRKIQLSWKPIKDVEGFYLYRRTEQEPWEKVARIRGTPELPYTDDRGLEDGRTYAYYLTAYDTKGESGQSNTIEAETKALPSCPTDIIVQSGLVKSVEISWTPATDPDVGGYIVYRGTDPKNLRPITKIKGYQEDSYLDTGTGFSSLEDGTDYLYALTSFNLFGAEGPPTPTALAQTKPPPVPASGIKLTAAASEILVRWQMNPEPDIRRYVVYRSRNSGLWSNVGETEAGKAQYRDTDLDPESEYRYRIIVEDNDGLKSDPAESDAIESPILPDA